MVHSQQSFVLTINAGSSSIRFALFPAKYPLQRSLFGKIDRIGQRLSLFTYVDPSENKQIRREIKCRNNQVASKFLIDWLEGQIDFSTVQIIGHRVVFGMKHFHPERVTRRLLDELQQLSSYDSEHLPREIEIMKAFRHRYPRLPQVVCFDSAFHRSMPPEAQLLPIPRRFNKKGIQKYGFHGLSFEYLMGELARVGSAKEAHGRVILAHLGNGASLAAVLNGKSRDTSMGFTPTGGIPMGTRSGDLDPGLVWTLMRAEHLSPEKFNHLVNHESGLLGISETSADMRDLIQRKKKDFRAEQAFDLFCYQIKKWIGAYAGVLGGVDTLVFSGGMGENSPEVRARVCEGLEFLGIQFDSAQNKKGAKIISGHGSKVKVRVIPTDEEVHIANLVLRSKSALKKERSK